MTKQKPPDGIAELTCTNISVRVHVTYLPEYVAKRDDVANPVFLSAKDCKDGGPALQNVDCSSNCSGNTAVPAVSECYDPNSIAITGSVSCAQTFAAIGEPVISPSWPKTNDMYDPARAIVRAGSTVKSLVPS